MPASLVHGRDLQNRRLSLADGRRMGRGCLYLLALLRKEKQMAKCVQHKTTKRITRCCNDAAAKLVQTGQYQYVAKSDFKRQEQARISGSPEARSNGLGQNATEVANAV